MGTERTFYASTWQELESPRGDDALPGLHLQQRRVEGVFVPVGWHGRVRRIGGRDDEVGFLKVFDHPRLRDDFASSYERAIDQRAVDRWLEGERAHLLAEIACARRGLTHVCELLDHRVEDGGQRIYAVYRHLDPERRMDRLLTSHRGEPWIALGMLHALGDVLAELEAAGIVHGRLHERAIYFPQADGDRLGAPRLLPFEPGATESFDRWLRLTEPEADEFPWHHALTRVLPALHLHQVLAEGTREPVVDVPLQRLAEADFARRFPQWHRELRRALEPRSNVADVVEVGHAAADGGIPIRPRPATHAELRHQLRERLARQAYAEDGDLRPTCADDRRAFFRILLRALGGQLHDVLGRTAREAGPETNWVESFERQLGAYLEHRAQAYEEFAPFAPWLAGGLRSSGEPPELERLRDLLHAGIETRLHLALDGLVGRAPEAHGEAVRALRSELERVGLAGFLGVCEAARRDGCGDGFVAVVQVRDRVRRYRIVHRAVRGLPLEPDLVLFDSRARGAFCLAQAGKVRALEAAGEIEWRGNRHPYRVHQTADRRILEFEGYYGERTLVVGSTADEAAPLLRIGTRRGRTSFDFRARREEFEPVLTLRAATASDAGRALRYGYVVEERARRIVADLGITVEGRPLRDLEVGSWVPFSLTEGGARVARITIPEEGSGS